MGRALATIEVYLPMQRLVMHGRIPFNPEGDLSFQTSPNGSPRGTGMGPSSSLLTCVENFFHVYILVGEETFSSLFPKLCLDTLVLT
jgi:hypothetical protein